MTDERHSGSNELLCRVNGGAAIRVNKTTLPIELVCVCYKNGLLGTLFLCHSLSATAQCASVNTFISHVLKLKLSPCIRRPSS